MRSMYGWMLAATLAGCALFQPPPLAAGQTEAQVLGMLGKPTARYALGDGAARLEFAKGPYGVETWMVDFDRDGKVRAFDQVLTESKLMDFQARAPGMARDALLLALGTPSERRGGGRAGGQVWSWRYYNTECRWFQISVDDSGRATSATFGYDPPCDAQRQAGSADTFN